MSTRLPRRFPSYRHDDVLALIDLVYAAATDATGWPTFLERLVRTVGAANGSVVFHGLGRGSTSVAWDFDVDPAAKAEYESYYAARNIYLAAATTVLAPGFVAIGEEYVSPDVAKKSEFFNDFLRPMGLLSSLNGCIDHDDQVTAMLNVPRASVKPMFGKDELRLLRVLMPHLQRAVSIHRRLENAKSRSAVSAEILERLRVGVMLLGGDGGLVFMNRAAQGVLERNDGLQWTRTGPVAARSVDTVAFRRLIASACRPAQSVRDPQGGTVQIARPSGRRAFEVLIAPFVRRESKCESGRVAAAVFLTDSDTRHETPSALLASYYGLTPTEAVVTGRLLEGARVSEIADRLDVSTNTVRTHVKRVFSKLDVSTQSELIRVLLTGLTQLRADPGSSVEP